MVADYFPPDKRSTANAVLSSANFVGIALSSMTILLIKAIGWRQSYVTMGSVGLVGALSMLIFVRNPKRGRFEPELTAAQKAKKEQEEAEKAADEAGGKSSKGFFNFIKKMGDMMQNPVCKNVFIAGFLRSIGSVIVTAFVPVFF